MSWKEGDLVFFFHPKHSWVAGNVVGSGKGIFSCKANDVLRKVIGETVDKLKEEQITQCREDLLEENVNDLLSLTILHDATLLRCLFLRYMKDIIYTNIGAIVVALNPFNFKIPAYMDDKMPNYIAEGERIEVNLPHSWAQAHNTYYEMMGDRANQCILVSGESGAGKTEASKIVMKYLANISYRNGTAEDKAAGVMVGTRLSQCSPVLEAFGNAKTVRNDNSSRFGKFMKVKFTNEGYLVGAHTTKYLLEKSRIITASPGERVYHAFYILARGKDKGPFGLVEDKLYKSLNAGNMLQNPDFNTAEDYDVVLKAMAGVGMTPAEIESVWSCTAGILSMPNVLFKAEEDGCSIDGATSGFLDTIIRLLKINGDDLKKELVTTTLEINKSFTVKKLNVVQARDGCDALCKALYDTVFQWLVDKCNAMCDVQVDGNWIGLLDIFGFEDFELNSFEQICINLANETLQNHYNSFIFTKDMDECRAEGIDVTEVKCPDNSPCLRLITAKMGIIDMLDEECSLGQGTDLAFLQKVVDKHSDNPFFEKKKLAKTSFIVKHYAGNVSYEVEGWLEKNRDTLKDAMKIILRKSANELIATLLPEPIPADQKKGKGLTVGGFFKTQVQALMDVINSTNPHWIRCVKPHPAKKPLWFDGITTMNQLESSGVLGTVKIRKAGYPVRIIFEKFQQRFSIITARKSADFKVLCQNILTDAGLGDKALAQVGATKVFLKSEAFPLIERKRMECLLKYSFLLQKVSRAGAERMAIANDYWKHVYLSSAEYIQKEYREYLDRSKVIRQERARIRAEMEAMFLAQLAEIEAQETQLRDAMFEEIYVVPCHQAEQDLNQGIESVERMYALWRDARVQLEQQEGRNRKPIEDEYLAGLKQIRPYMMKERLMLLANELVFTVNRETPIRKDIENLELSERNRIQFFERKDRANTRLEEINGEYDTWRHKEVELEALLREELFKRASLNKNHVEQFLRMTGAMLPYIADVKEQVKIRQKRLERRSAKITSLRNLLVDEDFRLKRDEASTHMMAERIRISWEEEQEGERLRNQITKEYEKAMRDDEWRRKMLGVYRSEMNHASHLASVKDQIMRSGAGRQDSRGPSGSPLWLPPPPTQNNKSVVTVREGSSRLPSASMPYSDTPYSEARGGKHEYFRYPTSGHQPINHPTREPSVYSVYSDAQFLAPRQDQLQSHMVPHRQPSPASTDYASNLSPHDSPYPSAHNSIQRPVANYPSQNEYPLQSSRGTSSNPNPGRSYEPSPNPSQRPMYSTQIPPQRVYL